MSARSPPVVSMPNVMYMEPVCASLDMRCPKDLYHGETHMDAQVSERDTDTRAMNFQSKLHYYNLYNTYKNTTRSLPIFLKLPYFNFYKNIQKHYQIKKCKNTKI